MERWNTTWLGMPDIILIKTHKFQKVMLSKEFYSKRDFSRY
jgi:hypothetical protein